MVGILLIEEFGIRWQIASTNNTHQSKISTIWNESNCLGSWCLAGRNLDLSLITMYIWYQRGYFTTVFDTWLSTWEKWMWMICLILWKSMWKYNTETTYFTCDGIFTIFMNTQTVLTKGLNADWNIVLVQWSHRITLMFWLLNCATKQQGMLQWGI